MHFLNFWYLWFLPALAIPLMLNILKKRKIKDVEFPYFDLLFNINVKNLVHLKIVNYLLLFLRMALLAGIIIFMARPVFVSKNTGINASGDIPTVFIIDNSPSMTYSNGTSSFFKAALVLAEKYILALNRNVPCALIYMNEFGSIETTESYSNPDKLLAVLRGINPQNHKFALERSIELAVSFLRSAKSASGKIIVLTDNQKPNWTDFRKPDIDTKFSLNFVYPRNFSANTAGITGFRFSQRLPLQGEKSFITVTLKNFSSAEWKNIPLSFYLENELTDKTVINLKPQQAVDHVLYYKPDFSKGFLKGLVKFDCPDFNIDNNIFISFPSYMPQPIYIVGQQDINIYLKAGLNIYINESGTNIKESKSFNSDYAENTVTVFNNYKYAESTGMQIKNLAAKGNCVLIFYPPDTQGSDETPVAVSEADLENPVLHPYKRTGKDVFSQIQFIQGKQGILFPELQKRSVIMKSSGDTPFLEEITLNRGKLFVFYTDLLGNSSNFVNTNMFVPLLHRVMDRILVIKHGDREYYNRSMDYSLDLTADSRFSVKWTTPLNQVFTPAGIFVNGVYRINNLPFDKPGFYNLESGSSHKIFACNIPYFEGDMTQTNENEILKIFHGYTVSFTGLFDDSENIFAQHAKGPAILIFICVLLSIIELLIANLTG